MKNIREYLSEFKTREGIIAFTSIFLICIYIYHGGTVFFNSYIATKLFPSSSPFYMDFYARIYQCISVFTLFFIIPLLIIILIFKEKPSKYGLHTGEAKSGIKAVIFLLPLFLPFLYIASTQSDFIQEYPLPVIVRHNRELLIIWEVLYIFYYIGWEFMFRGFILFGLERKLGSGWAIIFQTIPSTLVHIGKPEGETISAIFAGVIFGILALRTRSMLYPLFIHYIIGVTTDLLCSIR